MTLEVLPVRVLSRVERAYLEAEARQRSLILQAHQDLVDRRQQSKMTTKRSSSHIIDGFVYVVASASFPNWVKIGSTLDLKGRVDSYQTYSPFADYQLVFAHYFSNRVVAEKDVHTILQAFRGKGEWFAITPDQAKEVILMRSSRDS